MLSLTPVQSQQQPCKVCKSVLKDDLKPVPAYQIELGRAREIYVHFHLDCTSRLSGSVTFKNMSAASAGSNLRQVENA